MKCEICHKADAQTAITRGEGEEAEELYVCNACAKAERQSRQKKSQRTRKVTGLPPGMSMSITEIRPVCDDDETDNEENGDEDPPPFIQDLISAVSDLEKMASEIDENGKKPDAKKKREEKFHTFPTERVDANYRIGTYLHLEGLHLIGELEATKRALHALDMELVGVDADGVYDAAHVFMLNYAGSSERAKRVVGDILREERNARVRLFEEIPRVFGDSLCRALAILKNCRLVSPGEVFDLLSPLRLAAKEKLLEGITYKEIEKMMALCDLSNKEEDMDLPDREKVDAERADEMNKRFEDVVLNERAEGKIV